MALFKKFLILFLAANFISAPPAFAEEKKISCPENPRDCFTFDDKDKVSTDSGAAERTFSLPPMKVGFIVDFKDRDILPHWTIQIPHASVNLPWLGELTLNMGVATSRVFASIDFEFVPIVRIGPTVWYGYNVKEKEAAYGLGFSILDF